MRPEHGIGRENAPARPSCGRLTLFAPPLKARHCTSTFGAFGVPRKPGNQDDVAGCHWPKSARIGRGAQSAGSSSDTPTASFIDGHVSESTRVSPSVSVTVPPSLRSTSPGLTRPASTMPGRS